MTIRPGTQAYAIFSGIRAGWDNAPDLADELGMDRAKVSAWLCRLARGGLIQHTDRRGSFGRGRPFNRYAPANDDTLRYLPSGAIRARR